MINTLHWHSIIKKWFSLQLWVPITNDFLFRSKPHIHISISVLKSFLTCNCAGLCFVLQSLSSLCINTVICMYKILHPCTYSQKLVLNIFLSLLFISLSLEERALPDILFRSEWSKVSYSLHMSCCVFLS